MWAREGISRLEAVVSGRLFDSAKHHIFHKDPVPSGAVLDKHVGHGSDELSVLDDGAAAHALDDSAGEGQKFRVRDLDYQAFILVGGGVVHFLYLDLIIFYFPGNAASDNGRAFFTSWR